MADKDLDAAIALTRFGLGARPGELAVVRSDPRGWLLGQIRPEGAEQPEVSLASAQQRYQENRDLEQIKKQAKADTAALPLPDDQDPVKIAQKRLRAEADNDTLACATLGALTDAGFRERWALFWANHFTVSALNLELSLLIGPFEQEAIRPHVFGPFHELLNAADTHPAMLLYLDQTKSIGPNSPSAMIQKKRAAEQPDPLKKPRIPGLNENLAREIMELHSVGVKGGYTQADVTEFARAMTGLTLGSPKDSPDVTGAQVFRPQSHEPGDRTVMGVTYPAGGLEQSRAIRDDLAAKPQTARFICGKIARHFVADDPPKGLVARLTKTWMATHGDLADVAEALITAPEAWTPQPAKFKTPFEFLISSWRAAGGTPKDVGALLSPLTTMGQKPFSAPSPKGWADDTLSWAAPDAIVKRMAWAQKFTDHATADRDPRVLAADALGARLQPATATMIARAESRSEGFALLLMSPEFQRR